MRNKRSNLSRVYDDVYHRYKEKSTRVRRRQPEVGVGALF